MDQMTTNAMRETIYAMASGHGLAGIAVIRISGPRAHELIADLSQADLPEPRFASLRRLYSETGDLLDEALCLLFEQGASYTGEKSVELHCHGGRAVVRAVLDRLGRYRGCRLAEPGEFTRRAVEAGRMDLADAESLGDLIHAETEAQRRQAARGFGGALHAQAEAWRQALVRALALVEVTIDWADEEVPEDVTPEVAALISGVSTALTQQLVLSEGAERLRQGFEVAILGAPNAGKSTLLNALAGREAAITSEISGTTRDIIELRYDLHGLPVIFLDTAGLRETEDAIEQIGVARALERGRSADLRLFLRTAACAGHVGTSLWQEGDINIWSKSDLGTGPADIAVSARSGEGLADLLSMIYERLSQAVDETALVGHARQRAELERSIEALGTAEGLLGSGDIEMTAYELRQALRGLERLLGRVDIEDVLGEIFSTFCLGK